MFRLIVFDCDDTIWKTPYDECDDFMKLDESILDYEFDYNQEILDIYHRESQNSQNKFVLLTNRTTSVSDIILNKIKEDSGLFFNYTLFRTNNRDKSERLSRIIDDTISEIVFYDDKDKHLDSIEKLKDKYPNIQIKTYKVEI